MLRLFTGATIFYQGKFVTSDFLINNSQKFEIYNTERHSNLRFDEIIDCSGLHVFPGFIDPHVHLREPGFEYKDTIKTSTLSAAVGGYTTVFAMSNLKPAPDNIENLAVEKKAIEKNAVINVIPVCAITKGQTGRGELSDIRNLLNDNKLFSDDGKGVQSAQTMEEAMNIIKQKDAYVLAHCEDEEQLENNDSRAAEYLHVQRDIGLSKKTNCKYHICHISTKESVDALRKNKTEYISGEVTPHHLFLNETNIHDEGKWKMNPPLRPISDQQACIDGLIDGTIEMICTDNAPHSSSEKNCPYDKAAMGIVSIEVAFPLVYTKLVKTNKITLNKAIELMSTNVAKFFNIEGGQIIEGQTANLCFYDLERNWTINALKFVSMGKSCPFDGEKVYGKCVMTISNGEIVYREMK